MAVLLLAGVALIVNATALTLNSGRRAALLVGGLAAVIGLTLALLFALGTPWRGPISVSGKPIDAVVHDLSIGYFHPLPRLVADSDRSGSVPARYSQTYQRATARSRGCTSWSSARWAGLARPAYRRSVSRLTDHRLEHPVAATRTA